MVAYDWASLPEGSYFVDVGGGMGGVTMGLLKAFPNLKGVVQDLSDAVSNGRKVSTGLSEFRSWFTDLRFYRTFPSLPSETAACSGFQKVCLMR